MHQFFHLVQMRLILLQLVANHLPTPSPYPHLSSPGYPLHRPCSGASPPASLQYRPSPSNCRLFPKRTRAIPPPVPPPAPSPHPGKDGARRQSRPNGLRGGHAGHTADSPRPGRRLPNKRTNERECLLSFSSSITLSLEFFFLFAIIMTGTAGHLHLPQRALFNRLQGKLRQGRRRTRHCGLLPRLLLQPQHAQLDSGGHIAQGIRPGRNQPAAKNTLMKEIRLCGQHFSRPQSGKQTHPQSHQTSADERIAIGINPHQTACKLQPQPYPVLASPQKAGFRFPFLRKGRQLFPLAH